MPEAVTPTVCKGPIETTQRVLSFQMQADTTLIRNEQLLGKDFMVVPIVALVEGVLTPGNSNIKELALASEFGKAPVTWNGRPITLNHPKRSGSHVSASQTPQIFEEEQLGFIFNAKIDDKKLKVEAWIDTARVNGMGDTVKKQIDRLKSGEAVEVSTGLFTALEDLSGTYNGQKYDAIWRGVIPDHLAILEEGMTGACSVEAGCGGPRVNCAGKTDCGCGCSKKGDEMPVTNEHTLTPEEKVIKTQVEAFKGLAEKFGDVYKLVFNTTDALSDTDTRSALQAAVDLEDDTAWAIDIIAVFASMFIYMRNWDGKFMQRTYSISTDGTVVLGSEKLQVRPVTTFVSVSVKEEVKMSTQTENPATVETPANPVQEPTAVAQPAVEAAQPTVNKSLTTEEFLASAPAEMQEVLREGLRLQSDRRNQLIAGIKANQANSFTDEQLKGMKMDMLESLSKLASPAVYAGRVGGAANMVNNSSDAIPSAPKVFAAKTA